MNELIFERIAQADFLRAGQVDREGIARAPLDKLIALMWEISEITSAEYIQRERASFTHAASLSLAGSSTYP